MGESLVPATDGRALQDRRTRLAGWLVAAGLVLAVLVGFAVLAGRPHRTPTRVLTGDATVGIREASVRVGGWVYGVQDSVPWRDAQGSEHDSGWPSCLAPVGATVRMRFAEVPVTLPDGWGWRAVVWVDCSR